MMRVGEALDYIEETYGLRLTNPTLIRYVKRGRIRGAQPGGPHAWWIFSRESIDEMFGADTDPAHESPPPAATPPNPPVGE
jgi:hypothetical protein